MFDVISITLDVLAPVFIVIGLAALVGRIFDPDPRPLSTLLLYLFVPALVLDIVASAEIGADDVLRIGGVIALLTLILGAISIGVARMLRLDRAMTAAFIVSVVMVNAANYGIPVNEFAFGDSGMEIATIYYVLTAVIVSNVSIFIASQGRLSVREALMNVIRVPIFAATLAGLALNLTDVTLPTPVGRSVEILSSATIPVMLTLLGLSIAKVKLGGDWTPVLAATGVRLIGGALVAFPLAFVFGLEDVMFNVTVVQSSTPTAVLAAAIALEFGSHSQFVSKIILVSTVLSLITMTILLAFLGVS